MKSSERPRAKRRHRSSVGNLTTSAKRGYIQDAHTAMWSTYLRPDVPHPVWGAPRGASLPDLLEKSQAMVPRPLLGIALWNLLPQYDIGRASPPQSFERLLRAVLDLDLKRALFLRGDRPNLAFPPYPDHVIIDARCPQQPDRSNEATLEICVPTTLNELSGIVDPLAWATCSLFWSEIRETPPVPALGKHQRYFTAKLSLPGGPTTKPQRVRFGADIKTDQLEAHVTFTMDDNPLMQACRGSISVKKEPGYPGATRIKSKKMVHFAQSPLKEHPFATLMYWLQAETVSLAFAH